MCADVMALKFQKNSLLRKREIDDRGHQIKFI